MFPKLYKTNQVSAPWLVVYSDPTSRAANGRPVRVRFRFAQKADAEAKLRELHGGIHIGGVVGLVFDTSARLDWQAARRILDVAGYAGTSLVEVAREWTRGHVRAAHGDLPVADLLEEFLHFQSRLGREVRTRANLGQRVSAWLNRERIATLADITDARIRALKLRDHVSAQTLRNDMAAVSSFLSYLARERNLIPANPLKGVTKPTVDGRIPRTLTPDQAAALMAAAQSCGGGRLLRYFTLCLFAGLRPGEAAAMDPSHVVLARGQRFCRVLKGKRRGHRRQVPLSAAFAAWWKAADPSHPLPLFDWIRDRPLFDAIRRVAGLIPADPGRSRARLWQSDICRHTWISVRLVETQNEAQVALEAGTSIRMIHGHYLEWLTKQQARAIAAIRPTSPAPGSA